MSSSNKVPNGVCSLTLQDWSDIFGLLAESEQKNLSNLIETKLRNKAKGSNSKKRRLSDLNDEENEDIDIEKEQEPPKKKLKTDNGDKKESNDEDINVLCVKLIEQSTKDGIKKIVVGGLILNDKNEMLVLQRAKTEFMPNIYEIASGKKESTDNTLIDCLSREVKEESGLELRNVLKAVGSFDYKSNSGKATRQFNFCITVESTEKVIISEEHQAFAWIQESELFEKESQDNKYNDIVSKITPQVRDILRNGYKILNDIK